MASPAAGGTAVLNLRNAKRRLGEHDVFAQLQAAVDAAVPVADAFERLIRYFPDRDGTEEELQTTARESRRRSRELTDRLAVTFVTPIEREDMLAIVAALGDSAEAELTFAERLSDYGLPEIRSEAAMVARLLLECAAEINKGVALVMRRRPPIADPAPHVTAVHERVTEGRRIERAALSRLFAEPATAVELVAWTDLFERLQAAASGYERAAVAVEIIALKRR
jgi:uncharacterized protein Yka (UPF0111/DUF47 family)